MTLDQPHIQFCFDYISPYSYLAATQMPMLKKRLDVPVVWQPINLPRLIEASGNVPPATIPNKARYLLRDLKMWADHLDVPFRMIKPGSFDSRPALAATVALQGDDRARMALALFDALWSGRVDPRDADWPAQALAAAGLPEDWYPPDACPKHMEQVDRATDAILKAGAFGAPSFFIEGMGRRQMFWGIDRIDFLAAAVMARRPHP